MLRTLVAALLLAATPAAAQELRGRLHVLEVIVEYGGGHRDHGFEQDGGDRGKEYTPTEGLRVRCRTLELPHGRDDRYWKLGPHAAYGGHVDGGVHFVEQTRFRRARTSLSTAVRPENTLFRLEPDMTFGTAGTVWQVFCIADVLGEDGWPRPHRGDDPRAFLETAVERFEETPSGDHALFLLQLICYVPLETLGPMPPAKAEDVVDRLAELVESASPRITLGRHRGGARFDPIVLQARLVNAPWSIEESGHPSPRRTWASYPLDCFIAESDRHDPAARRIAFERCLRVNRDVDSLRRWIALIESGGLPIEESHRAETLAALRNDVLGRAEGPIAALVIGGMLALVVVLFTLRFVARRTMF